MLFWGIFCYVVWFIIVDDDVYVVKEVVEYFVIYEYCLLYDFMRFDILLVEFIGVIIDCVVFNGELLELIIFICYLWFFLFYRFFFYFGVC